MAIPAQLHRPPPCRVHWMLRAALMGICGGLCVHAPLPVRAAPPDDLPIAAQRLRAAGLRPVLPPSPATEVALANLAGDTVALSSFDDRWVLLTFFATWCGPCATEMPTLQRLHGAADPRRLAVIAVATDQNPTLVGQYARGKGLDFPILLDTQGRAASSYRAHSIPTSYLIAPGGLIVGVARGARDWSGLAEVLDAAQGGNADTVGSSRVPGTAGYRPSDAPIELPSTLVPPTATATLVADRVHPGERVDVRVRVHWAGTFDDYLLLPPHVALPDSIEAINTAATTSSTTGDATIDYAVSVRATEPGEFRLDPIEVRYTPHGENEPVVQRIAGPTLHVVPRTMAGLAPTTALASAAGLALIAGCALWLVRRRRRPSRAATASTAVDADTLSTLLERARRARLEGDATTFLEHACSLYEHLDLDRPPDLEGWMERARYGGQTPPPSLLDDIERTLRRVVAQRRPNPEGDRLQSIALAEAEQKGHNP